MDEHNGSSLVGTEADKAAQEGDAPLQQRVSSVNAVEHPDAVDNGLKRVDCSNSALLEQISAKVSDIATGLQKLSSFQAEQSQRMRRFEEGYDYQIFKNFAKQIVREVFLLENQLAKTVEADKRTLIQDAIDFLGELLERNSVTRIIPKTGSLYAGQEKTVECVPVKVFTEDTALNGRIAAVVHTGFLYEFNDGSSRVIAPAKVHLYSNNRDQCSAAPPGIPALTNKVKRHIQTATPDLRVGRQISGKTAKFILALPMVMLLILSTVLGLVVFRQSLVINELVSGQQVKAVEIKTESSADMQPRLPAVHKTSSPGVDQ